MIEKIQLPIKHKKILLIQDTTNANSVPSYFKGTGQLMRPSLQVAIKGTDCRVNIPNLPQSQSDH